MRVIELLLEQQARLQAEGKAAPYTPSFDEPVVKEPEPAPEPSEPSDWSEMLNLIREEQAGNKPEAVTPNATLDELASEEDLAREDTILDKSSGRISFFQKLLRRFKK
jgi:hypothetical protein